jgi:hypothetical protein
MGRIASLTDLPVEIIERIVGEFAYTTAAKVVANEIYASAC